MVNHVNLLPQINNCFEDEIEKQGLLERVSPFLNFYLTSCFENCSSGNQAKLEQISNQITQVDEGDFNPLELDKILLLAKKIIEKSNMEPEPDHLSLDLALNLVLLPDNEADQINKCLQFLSVKTGQTFQLNEKGILEIKVTQHNAVTDELLECLAQLDNDLRSKVNFHISPKENIGKNEVEELVQKYGYQANSLSLTTDTIDDHDLEDIAKYCSVLNHLFIQNQKIGKVPKFDSLTTLDCSGCDSLTEISQLDSLTTLVCSGCDSLDEIPQLNSLTTLDCRWCNSLIEIPQLDSLTTLDCSMSHSLTEISQLDSLTTLVCSGCDRLTEIPQLDSLTTLVCSGCDSLTEIPQLNSLTTLDCRWCNSLIEIPQLDNLTTLDCCGCISLNNRAIFMRLLQTFFNDKEESKSLPKGFKFDISISHFQNFVVDYFNSEEEVVISHSEGGGEEKMTKGNLRIQAFNMFPFLFEYLYQQVERCNPNLFPKGLQDAVDSGQIREVLKNKYPNIGSKVISQIPFSTAVDISSVDIIQLIERGMIKEQHLPKQAMINQQSSFEELAVIWGNIHKEEWREERAFYKVLSQCKKIAKHLGFEDDERGQAFLGEMIKSTCEVKASKKIKNWSDFLSLLPEKIGKDEKDAIDDFIKTVFIPYYMQNHIADDLTAESLYQQKRLQMIEEFLRGVSVHQIAMLSKRWHEPGRLAQLNKAKSLLEDRWEPLFSTPLDYRAKIGQVIQVVPLTSSEELKEEGKRLEHCLGGYANDCIRNNTHILSLRDEEGNSLSTIELNLLHGKGKESERIINIQDKDDHHLRMRQHRGKRNADPSQKCQEVEKLFFNALRNGEVEVNLSELEKKRSKRVVLLERKKDILQTGYDPTDAEKFEEARKIYRKEGIGNFKKLRSNFDVLTGKASAVQPQERKDPDAKNVKKIQRTLDYKLGEGKVVVERDFLLNRRFGIVTVKPVEGSELEAGIISVTLEELFPSGDEEHFSVKNDTIVTGLTPAKFWQRHKPKQS